MKTTIMSIQNPEAITTALQILRQGGVIAFPTDTVYGLAALVNDAAAIEKLFAAKGRDFNKAIAVLVGNIEQVDLVSPEMTVTAKTLAARHWPGALTLVVPKRADLPAVLSALPTVGVRMPDHTFALQLLQAAGPLATTSANLSGAANPLTAQDVWDQLQERVDLILDGGACSGGIPSTVVDCTAGEVRILRHGAIPEDIIMASFPKSL